MRRPILSETITTASGLQYIDTVVGQGQEAKGGQKVTVHYTGWLYNYRDSTARSIAASRSNFRSARSGSSPDGMKASRA